MLLWSFLAIFQQRILALSYYDTPLKTQVDNMNVCMHEAMNKRTYFNISFKSPINVSENPNWQSKSKAKSIAKSEGSKKMLH
jgi:hypothetical protein